MVAIICICYKWEGNDESQVFVFLLSTPICLPPLHDQFELADNPLDGGRYFIENCMQGNFKKAKFYVVEDAENLALFEKIASNYYGLDKEGRQQIRLASIQINEISAVDSTMTIMNYQNSFDNKVHKLKIISTPKGWKVDLKYTYGPNL
jgi:hypothetical protein